MSDPDQEEIRRKRLARLGGAPINPSQEAASQEQKSHPTDTASDMSKDCSSDVTGSHEAAASSITTEDINMQVLGEQKESIKHETNDPIIIFASNIPAITSNVYGNTPKITSRNKPTRAQLAMKAERAKY